MYFILEYLALTAAVAIPATVAFGVASLILVTREGAKWLVVSSRRFLRRVGGPFLGFPRSSPKPEAAFAFVPPIPRKQRSTFDSELNADMKVTR
jgi:hypothetical protein